MLVDLKKHIVRVHGSSDLNNSGIASSFITNSLVPGKFIPLMKNGNLGGAIKSSLIAIDAKLKYQQQISTTFASQKIDPVMLTNPNHNSSVAKIESTSNGCRLSSSDIKVRIKSTGNFYYPDLMVSCELFAPKATFKEHPCFMF
jgi:hypothetical protein